MYALEETHTHALIICITHSRAAYVVETAEQVDLCTGQTTIALSSCTSQIKSNIVCYSIAEVFHDKEKYMELVEL